METPEARRQVAGEQLKLMQKEYLTDPSTMLGQSMVQSAMTATAANPHAVALAKKPWSVYRRYFGED
jgi:hypothetical protein